MDQWLFLFRFGWTPTVSGGDYIKLYEVKKRTAACDEFSRVE
jgi:hypothetical protein